MQFSRHQSKCSPRFSRNDPARRRRPPSTWWSARATRVHARSSTSFHLVCTCCRRSNAHECMFCRWRRRSASRWIVGRSMVLRAPRASVAPRMSHTFIALRLTPRERATPWQIVGGRFPDLRASFRVVIPGKTVAGRCARRASRSALCCVGIFHTTRAASAPPLLSFCSACAHAMDCSCRWRRLARGSS